MSLALSDEEPRPQHRGAPAEVALLVSVFVVAACGLVYELAAGALASYLLGDSVLQFSTIIGCYLFAMGIGSWLSRFVEDHLAAVFLRVELLVGLIGGLMPATLFLLYGWSAPSFRWLLYGQVLLIGTLVGLEIPLVMRLMRRHYVLKDLVSQVLTFDYLGALAVSLAFPLLFVPRLGLIRTGLLFGLMNAAVAVWAMWVFRHELRHRLAHGLSAAMVIAILMAAWAGTELITRWGEDQAFGRHIVIAETSPYQRIVVTRNKDHIRLFLNGNLQFSSRDEYRYHESLVHPVMSAHPAPRSVLVLGGGDGMAAREILRYPAVERVTLVDLDARVTAIFAQRPELVALNQGALTSPKVRIVNEDAFKWLEAGADFYDVIVVDLPDPTNYALGKLYTTAFYELVEQHLSAHGLVVVQTTSPLYARRSFWTVAHTLATTGLAVTPYHALVPSFGDWGYLIGSRRPYEEPRTLGPAAGPLRYLTADLLPGLFEFPADMREVPTGINHLNNQVLVQTFQEEWGRQLNE